MYHVSLCIMYHYVSCIIMYHVSLYIIMYHNNVTNLIHFSLSQSLYCVLILYMFRASSVHPQKALHSSFWCELRALVAVGWLKVVGRPRPTTCNQPTVTSARSSHQKLLCSAS